MAGIGLSRKVRSAPVGRQASSLRLCVFARACACAWVEGAHVKAGGDEERRVRRRADVVDGRVRLHVGEVPLAEHRFKHGAPRGVGGRAGFYFASFGLPHSSHSPVVSGIDASRIVHITSTNGTPECPRQQ